MAILLGFVVALVASVQASPAVPTAAEIEAEVLANVRNQPLGEGTVDDLALPRAFLGRVADRIVRSSFEERYRIVVETGDDPETPGAGGSPLAGRGAWWGIAVGTLAIAAVAVSVISRRGRSPSP